MRIRAVTGVLAAAFAIAVALPAAAIAQESGDEPEADVSSEEEIGEFEEECIEILEDGGSVDDCQEAPNPILPELEEILWGSAAFLLLFLGMWRFALPAIRNLMQQREDRIRNDLESAEQAKTDAVEVLEQYRAQLADARNEAGRIVDEARQAAETVAGDIKARAEEEATEIRARADADARHAADRAFADLQTQVGEMAIELAEKIVGRNLDRDSQMQLVESYIEEVGRSRR